MSELDFDESSESEHQRSPEREKQPEIIINYKRQLSPIIEESDEDTCRSIQLNETGTIFNYFTFLSGYFHMAASSCPIDEFFDYSDSIL